MTGSAPPRDDASRAGLIVAASRTALLTALAYWAAGRLGLLLAIPPGYATIVWPPAGIALAASVRGGWSGLAGVALGAFAVNCAAPPEGWSLAALALPAAIAFGSSLQAGFGAWVLRRFAAYPYAGATPGSVARCFALGGALSCVIAASVGNLALFVCGKEAASDLARGWVTWWGGDLAGVVVFGPALLAFDRPTLGASWRRAAPVVATAVFAFAATFSLVWIDVASVQRGVRGDFELLARDVASRVEATVDLGLQAVEGLAGDFATWHERDLGDFRALAEKLAAFGLGIQALEWIPKAPASGLAAYEDEMSRQWGKPFQVFERVRGKPVPVAPRAAYFPVGFVTPLKGNEGAIGFDLASNPVRNAALIKAQDSGASVATAGVKLVQNNALGILLFTPVYVQGKASATVEQRRAALKGFALGVFSAPDLVGVALRTSDISMLDYWLIDETDAGAPTVLASNSAAKPHDYALSSSSLFTGSTTLGEHIRFPVADRQWSFNVAPNAAYLAKHADSSPYWLLIGGMALSAFGVGFVLVSTDRQRQLADSRERDLENQKFALDQHAIVSITDARGVISYANDRFCEISGFPREQLIGVRHNLISSGKHDAAYFAELWAALRSGAVWHGEICNRNAAGELYWLASTIVPLTDRRGGLQTFIAICTDITARKRLEEDLERSRAFLQSVTDSMGEGVYTIDDKGRCTFLNAEAERLIGWSFEEMRGRHLHDLVHHQDASGKHIPARDCAIMRTLRDVRKIQSEDQVFTHRDGRVFPVSIAAVRLERDGKPAGSVVVFQDITERRRVLQELKESEQRLSVALSASSTGLWDVYPTENRAFYSETWFRMLGYEPTPSPHDAQTFFALLHPHDFDAYFETLNSHEAGATAIVEVEFRMRRADGEWAWIRSIGKIVERDADGRPTRLIGVHIDTTAAHAFQNELAYAKEVAVRASQAKSEFLATMSHEIRTPMNAIIGLSHLCARTELNPRQRDYLTKIQSASEALLAIINDILDYSKIEAGKLNIENVQFALDKVLEGVLTVISPKVAEKGLSLTVERAPNLPGGFFGDPLRISQLLTNLLSNATKFTSKGDVRVKLGGEPLADERYRLEVSVTDSGIGMSEAQMAMLFQPFTQADASTSRRFGGTGLGLAICRQICNLMQGEISVRSVEGVGSTFTFHVPLKLGAPAHPAPEADDSKSDRRPLRAADVRLPGVRILVVEDNPINQQVATELLQALGVETTVAGSGEDALEILKRRAFDLILMDMQMPGKDGLQTTAEIRAELGDTSTPIVAMTANAMAGDRERCLEAGMNDHIAKPVDPDRLALTLAHWLERRVQTPAERQQASAAVESAPPLAIAGLDVEFALGNLGGNAELYGELLDMFVEEHGGQAQAIAQAVANGNWKRVNALAHGLKGAAATLGALQVSEIAKRIEHAAREPAPDAGIIGPDAEALGPAIAEVVAGVAAHKSEGVAAHESDKSAPPANEILADIDELKRLLEAGDADAETAIERLAGRLVGAAAALRAADVARSASRYDFAAAAVQLAELRAEVANWS